MRKIILGLVGEMAAGKSTVTSYLKDKYGAMTFRFSDMLRDVLTRLHLEHSRSNLQNISTVLRRQFGDDLMSKVIALDIKATKAPFVIIEGIRRPSDVTYLQALPNFHVIALTADERTRFERIIGRAENPDDQNKTWEEFQQQGLQESEQKIKEIAATAEFTVDNNGAKEDLIRHIDEIIAQVRS